MRALAPLAFTSFVVMIGCGSSDSVSADAAVDDLGALDKPPVDVPVMDSGTDIVTDAPDVRDVAPDETAVDVVRDVPVDVARDTGPTVDAPPAEVGRVSMDMGGTTAIALDRNGEPSIAFGTNGGGNTDVVVVTRAGATWTRETVTTLPSAVARIGYAIDPSGGRHVGYAQYVRGSGVGYGFRLFAASRTGAAWTTRLLADHTVNHNTAVRPDIHVNSTGDVHVVIPLTTALSAATRVRHLALASGTVVDEEIAPRLAGSSFGLAIGRIAAAVHGETPLSLFTVADDESGPDTTAYYTTRVGTATTTAIGSFPDLGSSLTEVWGADLFRVPAGYIAVTADAPGTFGSSARYRVFRQGSANWVMNTVGPVRYAADNWCAAAFQDGTVALFVYAGVGMPVTSTELRLLLIRPDGTYSERVADSDVEAGLFCSAVTDATGVHVAWRKPDGGIYYQRIAR